MSLAADSLRLICGYTTRHSMRGVSQLWIRELNPPTRFVCEVLVSIPDGSSSPLSLLITIFLPDSRQLSVNPGQCDIGVQAGNFAITCQPTIRACSYVDTIFPVSLVVLDVTYKLFS